MTDKEEPPDNKTVLREALQQLDIRKGKQRVCSVLHAVYFGSYTIRKIATATPCTMRTPPHAPHLR